METRIVELREAHPWGPRKLARRLRDLGVADVPAPATVSAVLRRNGKLNPAETAKHQPFTRFERSAPNELWQMDFKGHVAMDQGRCHPLTVLDDHSRYSLGIIACADQTDATVREHLTTLFRRYGLPEAMLADNGSPWGGRGAQGYTAFEGWLLRLGIRLHHGRPYHPQTQGKDERFHRSLDVEVLQLRRLADLPICQTAFDMASDLQHRAAARGAGTGGAGNPLQAKPDRLSRSPGRTRVLCHRRGSPGASGRRHEFPWPPCQAAASFRRAAPGLPANRHGWGLAGVFR
jgi:transposase InsO family protein